LFSNKQMGDIIEDLPLERDPPNHEEMQLIETFFKEKKSTMNKLLDGTKDSLLLFVFYILFSLPFLDETIKKFFPSTQSFYMLIMIKGFIFVLAYFTIKNLYLVRKN